MQNFVAFSECMNFISTLLLSTVHTDKSEVEILQNFVAFSEYMNYKVADNIDLPLITTEFLAYYRLRFHKEPLLVKKCDSNQNEQKQVQSRKNTR